jgi:hypothetical protein
MSEGAISSVYHALVNFFKANADKACDNPEGLIEKLIAEQGMVKRLAIRGYLGSNSNLSENVKQVNKHLAKLKGESAFTKECSGKNTNKAEKLAEITMEYIFTTPGLKKIKNQKSSYNAVKARGFKGGKRTRKMKKTGNTTYRRRR